MALLRKIQWTLARRALAPVAIDDFRTWKGATMMVAAWHVAREIERTSKAENVGLLLPTSGLFPAALLGAWMAGRTAVPLNYLLSRSDLEYIARDAGLDTVVSVGPMLEHVGGELPGTRTLRMDQMKFGGMPPVRLGPARAADDTLVILYTSGSSVITVSPKLWNCGSTPSITSFAPNSAHSTTCSTFEERLRSLSITPLGLPLVPLV